MIYITDFETENGEELPVYYHTQEVPDIFLERQNEIIEMLSGESTREMVFHAANLLALVAKYEGDDIMAEVERIIMTVINDHSGLHNMETLGNA